MNDKKRNVIVDNFVKGYTTMNHCSTNCKIKSNEEEIFINVLEIIFMPIRIKFKLK